MSEFRKALSAQLGASIPGVIGAGLGIAMQGANDRRQLKQQGKLTRQQMGFEKEMANFNQGMALDYWNKTNVGAQMKHYKDAGLNPALMYGQSGAGGQSMGISTSVGNGGNAPSGGGEIQGGMGMGLQAGMMAAQLELMKAQARKTNVEAENMSEGGVGYKNIEADTESKRFGAIISKWVGKEAESQFLNVKEPNRGIESKTWGDKMEAEQAVAGTLYELWVEGKLKAKGLAEVEEIQLKNANTREEKIRIMKTVDLLEAQLRGVDLDNMMKEMNVEMTRETGVDQSSNGLIKILARLFMGITGGGIVSPVKKIVNGIGN